MSKSFISKPLPAARAAVLLGLGVLAAAGALAQGMVNARVLSSTPVWEQVPVSQCPPGGYASAPTGVGAGVGALVGGLIGSQLGRGSGHIAGAIVGAFGGAALGNAAESQQRAYGCAASYQNRMSGYDVTYEYGGRSYRTRMAQDPGAWVQVPAPDGGYGAYDGGYGVQTYPVAPTPVAGGYPLPSYPAAGESPGVITAPPAGYAYPQQPYPQGYAYPPAVYPAPAPVAYPPVYRPVAVQPVLALPVGVSLSVGGRLGGHGRGGWGVGLGW